MPFGVLAAHIDYKWFPGAIVFMNIFFILSAYLITTLLIKDIKIYKQIRFKTFYARRFLRLFPAYYIMLGAYCLAVALFLKNPRQYYDDALFSGLYISNWIRAFSIETPDWLGHTWSLSIEEQYYLCWPLLLSILVALLGVGRRLVLALIIAVIGFAAWRYWLAYTGAPIVRLYNGTDVRADTLLIGCIIAVVRSYNNFNIGWLIRISRALVLPLGLFIFFVLGFLVHWQNKNVYTWGSSLIDISVGIFLFGLLSSSGSLIHRLFENRVLIYLGKISYSTYLWHYPIFQFVKEFHGQAFEMVVYGVPLTYFCAWLSYKFIEKPCIIMKRKFV